MGIYSDYINRRMTYQQLLQERKKQLAQISKLRGGRDIIVYAADVSNKSNAPVGIDFTDILPFQDQLSNLKGTAIDVILETPGGIAEAVEDIVRLIRGKYEHVGMIIPGTAKSAGTIFTMAGDEILMGEISTLGPIDAQINGPSKRYSAEAFLEGLEKIKADVEKNGRLNPAYIPILQNISPGEIQHCEHAQNFSKKLVTQWLSQYKFKYWDMHATSGKPVTPEDKERRAKKIADKLCKHSDWLTHGRSIPIADLEAMQLKITNYSKIPELNDAITRYYTLLKIALETTSIFKVIETPGTQIERHAIPNSTNAAATARGGPSDRILFNVDCPKCKTKHEFQAKLTPDAKPIPNKHLYPKNNSFICPNCSTVINLMPVRLQIESQLGKKLMV